MTNITILLQKYYKMFAFFLRMWYNKNVLRIFLEVINMKSIGILIYILIVIIFALIAYAIFQIK